MDNLDRGIIYLMLVLVCVNAITVFDANDRQQAALSEIREEHLHQEETLANLTQLLSEGSAKMNLRVSAYTARTQETDADPKNTAIMVKPKPGWTAAVSRDMVHLLGKKIYVEGLGVRVVNDIMAEDKKMAVDLCVGTVKEAAKVGTSERKVVAL